MFYLLKKKSDVFLLLFLIFTLVLSGCSPKQKVTTSQEEEKDIPKKEQKEKPLLPPAKIIKGEFVQVAGWLSDKNIAYIAKVENGYQLYAYELFTGEYSKLFQTKSEMVNVKISPNLERILIYTATSDDAGEITIIDNSGKQLYTTSLASYDADFVWNPYNEMELFVSTFTDDWKSDVYLLSLSQKQLIPLQGMNPFSQWLQKEELAYLDWEKDDTSFHAPIKTKNLQTKNETVYNLDDVYSMHVFERLVLTISTDPQNIENAVYTFYQHDFHKTSSFTIPHLSKFADWLVPFFDLKDDAFYTFIPKKSGHAESYNEGFDFISIDSKTGLRKKIVQQPIDNQPIQLSPNNDWCLYGHYQEKMINVKTGEIISLSNN
ncbi:YqgU-like beta propeller domain-containing protein [Niallia sp. 01092]|uniref:YqgU-like beta propeller domain-containing protein n=1 Tax=unclassified Niallia TaxID=2837522 RepID=UPI003FD5C0E1